MPSYSGDFKLLILNLPNPPFQHIDREYAGGFGTAQHTCRKRGSSPCLNLFLPYYAAVAKEAGCEYNVLDAQALKLSADEVMHKVRGFDPDVIVSMIALPSIYEDKKLLSDMKKELPNTLFVGCGTVCKVMPDEVLLGSNIDFVIRDEFPYVNSLRKLLNTFRGITKATNLTELPGFSYVKESKVMNNPPKIHEKEFSDFTPLYDDLPLKKYQHFIDLEGKKHLFISILGSKGCSHSCIYCPYPIGFGRKPCFKHPKSVVDEIEYLYHVKGIEGFLFRNQSFTLNAKWAKNVCQEILDRKLDISWFCEARVDEPTKEILALMQKSGCKRIHYGAETGDPELITTAKPGVRLENTFKTFYAAKKFGMWTHAHMILGLPGENKQTLMNTFKFLIKLDPDSVTFNFATPYPGTKLYNIAVRNNWIITYNWANYSSYNVVMRTNDLSTNDLYEAANKMKRHLKRQKILKLLSNPFQASSLRLFISDLLNNVRTF